MLRHGGGGAALLRHDLRPSAPGAAGQFERISGRCATPFAGHPGGGGGPGAAALWCPCAKAVPLESSSPTFWRRAAFVATAGLPGANVHCWCSSGCAACVGLAASRLIDGEEAGVIYLGSCSWTFFKIGAFTFGGGYAMLPLIQSEVASHGWMTDAQLVDFVAVSESTPGPSAVNISTYVGMVTGDLWGRLAPPWGWSSPLFSSFCWWPGASPSSGPAPSSRGACPACARRWWGSSPRRWCPWG